VHQHNGVEYIGIYSNTSSKYIPKLICRDLFSKISRVVLSYFIHTSESSTINITERNQLGQSVSNQTNK